MSKNIRAWDVIPTLYLRAVSLCKLQTPFPIAAIHNRPSIQDEDRVNGTCALPNQTLPNSFLCHLRVKRKEKIWRVANKPFVIRFIHTQKYRHSWWITFKLTKF